MERHTAGENSFNDNTTEVQEVIPNEIQKQETRNGSEYEGIKPQTEAHAYSTLDINQLHETFTCSSLLDHH